MLHCGAWLQVLLAVAERPHKGAALGRLAWSLGKGVGEYLPQQLSWTFNDVQTLAGQLSLAQVLEQRCRGRYA